VITLLAFFLFVSGVMTSVIGLYYSHAKVFFAGILLIAVSLSIVFFSILSFLFGVK
jgi:hypothetical protein